jgi:hypothetical protein
VTEQSTTTTLSFARSVTAAAKRIDLGSQDAVDLVARRKPEKWKREAWTYFDEVPEVKFAARFMGHALSRLRLFPAVVVDPKEPPVPITDAVDLAPADGGVSPAFAAAAIDALARVQGPDGATGLMREFGTILTISGDAYLAADDNGDGVEEWAVYSESAVTKTDGGRLGIRETPNGKATPFGPDALLFRVWRRHSQWPGLADSNMRAVLSECEELLIFGRQFRAIGRSKNSNGILFLSTKLDTARGPQQPGQDGLTKLERDVMQGMVTPSQDEGSAASIVPHIIRGDGNPEELIKHFGLDRKIDEKAIERIEFLIRRLAHGMDLPVEVLTGVAEANHWTAWQIEDSTYKAHVEPTAMIPASAIAREVVRPSLLELGHGVEDVYRLVVAVDPSDLVVRPNRGQDAKDAHKAGAMKDVALLGYLGFPDTDLPEPEERLLRLVMDRGIGSQGLTRDLLRLVGYTEVPSAAEAAEEEAAAVAEGQGELPAGDADQSQPIPDTQDDEEVRRRMALARLRAMPAAPRPRAIAAASTPAPLGDRLSALDVRLRDRLQIAASSAMTEALRVAGNRLRSRAQGDATAAEAVRGVDAEDVGSAIAAALEPDDFEALVGDVDTLLAGAFAGLEAQFGTWVRTAQDDVARTIRSIAPDEESADRAVDAYTENQDDDRDAGWLLLLGLLRGTATSRLFTPDVTPDDGEFDPTVAVQAGDVRQALARAGGVVEPGAAPSGTVRAIAGDGSAGGVATGPRAVRALVEVNQLVAAWEWNVGLPSFPFQPHQALAGTRFESWDDAALSNSTGFPAYGHYFPGDHRGCQCDAVPVIVAASELSNPRLPGVG